jgi:peptidase E
MRAVATRRGEPQVVAFGGGGFSMEAGNPLLDDYVLSLARRRRPRVCFLPTASGDADHYIVRFYHTFGAKRCDVSHVSLFRRERGAPDPRTHLLAQDVIYVGGGSVVSLLGTWRAHGLDSVLREAWESGIVLCGPSAGSLCWFDHALTAFHGSPTVVRGLGLLPWSNTVHYDAEPQRREIYHREVLNGMPAGYAAEDSAALHFVGEDLSRVVSSRPTAGAYRVQRVGTKVVETPLEVDYLGLAGGTPAAVEPLAGTDPPVTPPSSGAAA